ncbi:beta-fructofuranosidase, insoluble isoenzyme CWINV6-like protein [Tanacetum coccineum]
MHKYPAAGGSVKKNLIVLREVMGAEGSIIQISMEYGAGFGKGLLGVDVKYGKEQIHEQCCSFDIPPLNGASLEMCAERPIAYFKEHANVTSSFKLGDFKEVAVLDAISVNPQALCSERGASSKGAFQLLSSLASASKVLEERNATFFRVFQKQKGYNMASKTRANPTSKIRMNHSAIFYRIMVLGPVYSEGASTVANTNEAKKASNSQLTAATDTVLGNLNHG